MNSIPQSYNGKPLIHAWDYCAKDGAPFGVVGRYQDGDGKKDVVPFFKRNGSSWAAGIGLKPRPLYGLDKLAAQPKDKAVFIVEGEKSATALQGLGIAALTSLGGAQAAKQSDWTPLSGYKLVYILPDNNAPGEHYAQDVYTALAALESPPTVKVLRLDGLPDGGDIVDWLQGWVNGWDGYLAIDASLHNGLKAELRAELQKAEPIPENWALVGLVSAGHGVFDWEKPNEIESATPPVQALSIDLIPEAFRAWIADVSHAARLYGNIQPCHCGFTHWRGVRYQAQKAG